MHIPSSICIRDRGPNVGNTNIDKRFSCIELHTVVFHHRDLHANLVKVLS